MIQKEIFMPGLYEKIYTIIGTDSRLSNEVNQVKESNCQCCSDESFYFICDFLGGIYADIILIAMILETAHHYLLEYITFPFITIIWFIAKEFNCDWAYPYSFNSLVR